MRHACAALSALLMGALVQCRRKRSLQLLNGVGVQTDRALLACCALCLKAHSFVSRMQQQMSRLGNYAIRLGHWHWLVRRSIELEAEASTGSSIQEPLSGQHKTCPGCGIGILRERGHHCHHIAPGTGCPSCGTHFCYACLHEYDEDDDVHDWPNGCPVRT